MNGEVLVIAMDTLGFEETAMRYQKTKCPLPIIHLPGVKTTESIRATCTSWCELFATDTLIGCYYAHRSAWQYLLARPAINFLVVLEEDAHFSADFSTKLINDVLPLCTWYDFIAIGNLISGKDLPNIKPWEHLLHFAATMNAIPVGRLYKIKLLFGTHGYIITRQGAQILNKHLQKPGGHIDSGITSLINQHLIEAVGVRPSLVFQAEFQKSSQSDCVLPDTISIDEPPLEWMLGTKQLRLLDLTMTTGDLIQVGIMTSILLIAMTIKQC